MMMTRTLGVAVVLIVTLSVAAQDLRETIGEAYDLTHALDVAEDGSLTLIAEWSEYYDLPETLEATDAAFAVHRPSLTVIMLDLRGDELPDWLDTAKLSRLLHTWIRAERELAEHFDRDVLTDLLVASLDLAYHTLDPASPDLGDMLGVGILPSAMHAAEDVLIEGHQQAALDLDRIRSSARRLATRSAPWLVGTDPGGHQANSRKRIERVYASLDLSTGQLLDTPPSLDARWHGTWTGTVSMSPFDEQLRADFGDELPRNELTLTFLPDPEDPARALLTIEETWVAGDGFWADHFEHVAKPQEDAEAETIELRATNAVLGYWVAEIESARELEQIRAEDGEAAAQEAAEMFDRMVVLAGQPEDNRFEILSFLPEFGSRSLRLHLQDDGSMMFEDLVMFGGAADEHGLVRRWATLERAD